MKGTILLNYDENTKQVEEEEKTKFLKLLLDQIGISVEEFWTDEVILSVEQKIKLREVLYKFRLQVIDDSDGSFSLYSDNNQIAYWEKPYYILKKDRSQLDRKKQLYLEMHVNYWSKTFLGEEDE